MNSICPGCGGGVTDGVRLVLHAQWDDRHEHIIRMCLRCCDQLVAQTEDLKAAIKEVLS